LGLSPSISVDKSEKVHVILNGQNKETDILSSKVTQLNITYTIPNSDNLAVIFILFRKINLFLNKLLLNGMQITTDLKV
jgi:hypothetical protein